MQYYNVHSHIFTMSNAPKDFLQLYLPKPVASAVNHISDTQLGAQILQRVLRVAGNGGKRYADFLKIGKSKNQREVFESLIAAYKDDSNVRFVALTMNMEFCGAGSSLSFFEGQLEEILNVKKEYPDRLLIFLGLDPRWKRTGKELRQCVERYFETKLYINEMRQVYPFCGLKLYPSTGFYVFDERLKETFAWANENKVPILSHCNYLGGIYNNVERTIRNNLNPINPYTNKQYSVASYQSTRNLMRRLLGTNTSHNNKRSCSYFLDPDTYRCVFNHFKSLKICLAHFGGDEQIKAIAIKQPKKNKLTADEQSPIGATGNNWYAEIRDILTQYPNAYTDISYAVSDDDLFETFAKEAESVVYGDRVLFGTDFFMTEKENAQNKIYESFKTFALKRTPANSNDNLWNKVASSNIEAFLNSKYYEC